MPPLTVYSIPIIIALGLFLNTPLILTASALLYIFTTSIGRKEEVVLTIASAIVSAVVSAATSVVTSIVTSIVLATQLIKT